MFQAKLKDGGIFKRVVEAIKDLVTDVNIDVSGQGLSIQAMDSSHVALVALQMPADGFEEYRCDVPMRLGISIGNLSKVLKLGGHDDSLTLQSQQDSAVLRLSFQGSTSDKETHFNMNLMTLESEHLSIPDGDFGSTVTLNASEFSKVCRELYSLSETITIKTSQTGRVTFEVNGDVGSGTMVMSQSDSNKEDHCQVEVS